MKFVFHNHMPPKYHDHATHSSCQAGGLLVYIWDRERADFLQNDDSWVEIGAIIHQFYMRDDVSGCEPVYKANPDFSAGIGGSLSPSDLKTIISVIDNKGEWHALPEGEEYRPLINEHIDIEQVCRSLYPPTLEFKVNEDNFQLAMSKLMYRVISCAHQGHSTKEIVNNADLISKIKSIWSEVFDEEPDEKTVNFILYRGYFETIDG